MFLSERAQLLIEASRKDDIRGFLLEKSSICDAMSIIMFFYQMHASGEERKMLADAIDTLSNYNNLLTELSKEK